MALTTWENVARDCADSYRAVSDQDTLIRVGELAMKISELTYPGSTPIQPGVPSIPVLTDEQKSSIKNLMQDYFDNKSLFIYDGDFRRLSYAYPNKVNMSGGSSIKGCMDSNTGKYIINCGVFAQMIWMGRSISDFKKSNPSVEITKAFDWGYYFDFLLAKVAYGIKKDEETFYTANSYLNDSGNRSFITFDNAAAMAQELYRKGYEIPYSSVDIGDLVFYRSPHVSDEEKDGLEQSSFRYITHVGVVYNMTEYGPTILESTDAYTAALGRCGLGTDITTFGNVRGAGLENRIVMAARHPIAWGHERNVPSKFDIYRESK